MTLASSASSEDEGTQRNGADETVCNLYKMTAPAEAIVRLFGTRHGTNLQPFDDIYPDREAPVVSRSSNGEREIAVMHWGFPPPPKAGSKPVTNVRNLSSPFWRSALANPERRCLVPVTSFCEWTGEKGAKTKVWFEVTDQEVFAFAGIWRPAEDGTRMAFLTCEPNQLVGAVHPKAMPVILRSDDYDAWLSGGYDEAVSLARPYPDEAMRIVD